PPTSFKRLDRFGLSRHADWYKIATRVSIRAIYTLCKGERGTIWLQYRIKMLEVRGYMPDKPSQRVRLVALALFKLCFCLTNGSSTAMIARGEDLSYHFCPWLEECLIIRNCKRDVYGRGCWLSLSNDEV